MYISQVSGERLQDHWSSGFKFCSYKTSLRDRFLIYDIVTALSYSRTSDTYVKTVLLAFNAIFWKSKICPYLHILCAYVIVLHTCLRSSDMQKNHVMVSYLYPQIMAILTFLSVTIVLRSKILLFFGAKLLYLQL